MNRAALYSAEVLARFDQAAQEELQEALQADRKQTELHSGRVISKLPFGNQKEEAEDMSRAMVRVTSSSDLDDENNDEVAASGSVTAAQLALAQRMLAMQRMPFPASVMGKPGEAGAAQIATLQAKLMQRLGPEYISNRQGPSGGGRLSYIEGWKAIDLANEVFGFNGWSSQVMRMDVDFVDEIAGGRFNVGVSAVMRISLRDGTFHEDIGYGHCENVKMKHQALEKARKEATTDALKRALRTFGRMLGNCLYDKKFVEHVSRMKVPAPTFDVNALKRSPELRRDAQGAVNQAESSTSASRASVAQDLPNEEAQHHSRSIQQDAKSAASKEVQNDPKVDDMARVSSKKHSSSTEEKSDPDKRVKVLTREERLALAAAKKANLQKKRAAEPVKRAGESAQKAGLGSKEQIQDESEDDASNMKRAFPDYVLHADNVDEYDLALMEANMDETMEAMLQDGYIEASPRKPLLRSSMDDSAIAMVDTVRQPIKPMTTTGTPIQAAKGRFVDSSPMRDQSDQTAATLSSNQSTQRAQAVQRPGQPIRQGHESMSAQRGQPTDYKRGAPAPMSKNLQTMKKSRPNE